MTETEIKAPETDPTRIDWPSKQAAAAIPFQVVAGRPVRPGPSTGRTGQGELKHWGERQAADAVVLATCAGTRYLLMIQRGDGHGWALPGGCLDPEETPWEATVRELAEETGLVLTRGDEGVIWTLFPARLVPDPRGTDEAWMVTWPGLADLGEVDLPEVVGADDAVWAAWVRADDVTDLVDDLATTYGGALFSAHVDMIADILKEI
ncbi:NUDIX domain-containing protein [Streptosporangium saharense]|uniref:8-oxo-dGTP pyrophosphatase MutT (NUDIX family) n=1 Tax=Streptosporangium saharense TaxID=1706840 RepID=A0A7W7VSU3_9ACTN|nr:NUDIX domain-containing protein [Streptosporangium saharense]MBB4920999.1 8-oxo-dGTP pyrophosphatase MutT (NUDIX family) [Streptosporangium saharense]